MSEPAAKSAAAVDDERTPQEIKQDKELADRLSALIEDANARVIPLCKQIRKHIENMKARPDEDKNEDELVKAVRPLLEEVEKVLNETNGMVKGADPDNQLTRTATRNYKDHKATPEEQRLAEALKIMVEEVQGTIDWAKNELEAFPKAKKDLGPLLDALGQPLTQIVAGVGLVLAGVLNLLGKLLSGLGLESFLHGIAAAVGLDKIYGGLMGTVSKATGSGKKLREDGLPREDCSEGSVEGGGRREGKMIVVVLLYPDNG
ncbi:hypothetical protein FIBSPDRAFT_927879 [Athelia psychrophila]|uniref:DUF6987 domain-containing protein n=1 Tax=Athelia psychrophila TaxID=1759441 RepID=A0A166R512_9AGAM|nr:hypothetical protein FIBSPDRAFT_927879 [Fibularhizoctonia sp. CBS 109695]